MSKKDDQLVLKRAIQLLATWATDCDFGYDNIPDLYEEYKNDVKNMSSTYGLIYIALNEAKKQVEE